MYNAKIAEAFIEKVCKEAEAAAQQVFDKYNEDFKKMILGQIKEGDKVEITMGSCIITSAKTGEYIAEDLASELAAVQYIELNPSFNVWNITK